MQLLDRARHNRCGGSAPARMHRREGAGSGIAKQNRNTVGSFYCQQYARYVADQRVAVNIVARNAGFRFRFGFVCDHAHVGAVNLPAAGQGPGACEEFEEPAPVFVNVLGVIFVEAGEV